MADTATTYDVAGVVPAPVMRPVPTDDEAAAIVAALQLTTSAPSPARRDDLPSWRFSGRWWTQPIPLRRPRPWT